jgi:hypothetical protein
MDLAALKVYLRNAVRDGHDWRALWKHLQETRDPDWQPLPPEDLVDPEQPPF